MTFFWPRNTKRFCMAWPGSTNFYRNHVTVRISKSDHPSTSMYTWTLVCICMYSKFTVCVFSYRLVFVVLLFPWTVVTAQIIVSSSSNRRLLGPYSSFLITTAVESVVFNFGSNDGMRGASLALLSPWLHSLSVKSKYRVIGKHSKEAPPGYMLNKIVFTFLREKRLKLGR